MQDAWRAYLEMALGLTEAPRKKAQQVAGDIVNRGGATAVQLQGLAEDLLSSGMANREALTAIVRYEVDRALGAVGLATADEVAELTTRLHGLERQLRDAQGRAMSAEPTAGAVVPPATAPPGPEVAAPVDVVAAPGTSTVGDLPDVQPPVESPADPEPTGASGPAPVPTPAPARKSAGRRAQGTTPNAMPAAATDATGGRKAPGRTVKAGPVKAGPVKAGPVKAARPGKVGKPVDDLPTVPGTAK
jgi:polyhydroxyalkanoate synthesis regulator phasin